MLVGALHCTGEFGPLKLVMRTLVSGSTVFFVVGPVGGATAVVDVVGAGGLVVVLAMTVVVVTPTVVVEADEDVWLLLHAPDGTISAAAREATAAVRRIRGS